MQDHLQHLQEKYVHFRDLVSFIKTNYKVGDQIPSERDLADIVGYCRQTLRESLIRLECFGYVTINQGKPNIYVKSL